MSIFEVMERGPIVACNNSKEFHCVITANGAGLAAWCRRKLIGPIKHRDYWERIDFKSYNDTFDLPNGLMSLPLGEVLDRAEQYLQELTSN